MELIKSEAIAIRVFWRANAQSLLNIILIIQEFVSICELLKHSGKGLKPIINKVL